MSYLFGESVMKGIYVPYYLEDKIAQELNSQGCSYESIDRFANKVFIVDDLDSIDWYIRMVDDAVRIYNDEECKDIQMLAMPKNEYVTEDQYLANWKKTDQLLYSDHNGIIMNWHSRDGHKAWHTRKFWEGCRARGEFTHTYSFKYEAFGQVFVDEGFAVNKQEGMRYILTRHRAIVKKLQKEAKRKVEVTIVAGSKKVDPI